MIIEINKDIEDYKESVFFGMTAKQFISSILCLAVGGGTVFLLMPYVGLKIAAYITVPIVTPIAMSGFYSLNGMSYFEVWKRRFYFAFGNKALTYKSVEEKKKAEEIKEETWLKERK